jgi:hypothetical protein
MLNPSRTVVFLVTAVAVVCLALGLDTDVGLFGWTVAALLALYLAAAGIAHIVRRRSVPDGTHA